MKCERTLELRAASLIYGGSGLTANGNRKKEIPMEQQRRTQMLQVQVVQTHGEELPQPFLLDLIPPPSLLGHRSGFAFD
jgi:hypothetical protein